MKKIFRLTLLALILLAACTPLPWPIQENNTPTLLPTTEAKTPCAPENWKLAITSINQADLDDGTQLVFAKMGIENNDSLWGSLHGPKNSSVEETQGRVYLTTEDGSVYEYLDSSHSIALEQLSSQNQILLEATGQIDTPLLPPEFVTLGRMIDGKPHYYNFAFQIPDSQTPNTITIGGMEVRCIQPFVFGANGEPAYRGKNIRLPIHTYKLSTDIEEVHDEPSARKFPNLVGAELESPDYKEFIAVTGATREGDKVIVTFDFTNYSSRAASPSFNGYIIGNHQMFVCQSNCESQPTYERVQPGQTAQNLTWLFTVPEDEINLMFVYIYGDLVDLNEVYRVNLEG